MSSWAGMRNFPTKPKEVDKKSNISKYYATTTYNTAYSNLYQFILTYLFCEKNVELLYVNDTFIQSILKDESMIKYLKEVPNGATQHEYYTIQRSNTIQQIPLRLIQKTAQAVLSYNSETQGQILSIIRSNGLERTTFDVGLCVNREARYPASYYVNALQTLQKQSKKQSLSIFVLSENMKLLNDIKNASDPSWRFTQLTQNISPFNQLAELHILQTIPSLVVTFSSSLGKLLYITSRAQLTKDTVISVDPTMKEWVPF